MMATLIGWTQAESFVWVGNAPCMRTFQYRYLNLVRNPQTSAQLFGIDPGRHSGVGPSGVGNTVCKGFVDGTVGIPVAASPCCSIEITSNHVNLLTNHDGSDGKDELFGNTSFLA